MRFFPAGLALCLCLIAGTLGAEAAPPAAARPTSPGFELVCTVPVETGAMCRSLRAPPAVWSEMFDAARETIDQGSRWSRCCATGQGGYLDDHACSGLGSTSRSVLQPAIRPTRAVSSKGPRSLRVLLRRGCGAGSVYTSPYHLHSLLLLRISGLPRVLCGTAPPRSTLAGHSDQQSILRERSRAGPEHGGRDRVLRALDPDARTL